MKKSSKSMIIIAIVIVALLAFAFLILPMLSPVKDVETHEFFEKAGIVYTDDGITYNENKAVIKKISINVYSITGYEALPSGKYMARYESSLYPYDTFAKEIELLKNNGVQLDLADPNAGSFFSSISCSKQNGQSQGSFVMA